MAERNRVDIVLATGGSGGHIYPAVATGNAAKARGFSVAILGQTGGMEERIAAEEGFEFHGVPAGRWNRGGIPDPREIWKAFQGFGIARRIVRQLQPKVVIGFGGFASAGGAFAAPRVGVPLVLHEANVVPSLVNRRLSRKAELIVAARAEAIQHLPGAKEHLVLPYPIREEQVERHQAIELFGLDPSLPVVLVMGGSQGSLPLNRIVPRIAPNVSGVQFLHSTGPQWIDEVQEATKDIQNYHAAPYVHAPSAWAVADFAITRAGMGTITEAAFHGVPLIMVPLPHAADDHQLHNARSREAEGTGIVVVQGDLGPETESTLLHATLRLLDADTRSQMSAAAKALNPTGAADDIVSAVVKSIGL